MNKSKIASVSKETVYYLTNLFPLAFSMAACFGYGAITGIFFACLAIILSPNLINEKIMPVYVSFLILGCNTDKLLLPAWSICALLTIISSKFFDKIKKLTYSPAVSGIMLGTALTATVLFTTDYFGIGATGETVTEMIKSYISLGFHPNWRGVLYGTIVMVIMITFPRKFKKLSKTVSAAFIAIAATLILNLFLNPSFMPTSIIEIEKGSFIFSYFMEQYAPDKNILRILLCGFALFVNFFYAASKSSENEKDFYSNGIINAACSGIFGFPLPYGTNRNKNTLLPRCIATGIVLILFALFGDYFSRIPLHSCAVVVIVGAWQNVKWAELKKAFSGIIPILTFTVSIVSCLIFDLTIGITVSAIISVLYYYLNHKFLKKAV